MYINAFKYVVLPVTKVYNIYGKFHVFFSFQDNYYCYAARPKIFIKLKINSQMIDTANKNNNEKKNQLPIAF